MFVLLLTVFVDLVGFGIVFPMLPFYAQAYGASPFEITLLIATYSAVQMVSAPLWGRLSDIYGRKFILLATLAGGALAYLWFGFADSLLVLFLARALSGAMAGNISVAQAFMADLTPPSARAGAMGRVGAAFGLGFVVGPALGGLLIGSGTDPEAFRLPCYVATAISGAAVVLGLIALKEPPRQQRTDTPRGNIRDGLAAARRTGILTIIAMMFLVTFVFTQMVSVFPIWTQAQLAWGPREVGFAFAWIGVLVALLQGVVVGPATRAIGAPALLLLGTVAMSIGFLTAPLVNGLPGFLANAVFMCVGTSFCHPTLTALVSQRTPAEHQGSALGFANAISSFGRILAPPFAGLLFSGIGHNAPLLIGGLTLWPMIIAVGIMARHHRKERQA